MTDGYTYEDPNRKGVNRLEIPSYTFRHEFKDGFPAITTKKLHYKNVVTELIWFLRGDTNIKYLVDNGCNIWNKDAYNYFKKHVPSKFVSFEKYIKLIKEDKLQSLLRFKLGNLGPVYGKQWRDFNGVDQIKDLIQGLKDKPLSTEHIVTAWNPGEKFKMALPACHYGFQIVVRPLKYDFEEMSEECEKHFNKEYHKYSDGNSSSEDFWNQGWYKYAHKTYPQYGFELHWTQRSSDSFLGIPYNIASYATLALILEKITGYKALAIESPLKKVHLYDNSLNAVKEQLSRNVDKYDKCELNLEYLKEHMFDIYPAWETKGGLNIDKFINLLKFEDFKLEGYKSYPAINVKMLERDE